MADRLHGVHRLGIDATSTFTLSVDDERFAANYVVPTGTRNGPLLTAGDPRSRIIF